MTGLEVRYTTTVYASSITLTAGDRHVENAETLILVAFPLMHAFPRKGPCIRVLCESVRIRDRAEKAEV